MTSIIKDIKKILIKLKYNTGFTVIELLVSIFIISLISGAFLANYHAGDQQSKLINSSQKLVSDIRLAQNYALGLREFESSFPSGGWGVRLEEGNSDYMIFADDDIGEYDYDDGEEYLTIDLPENITISSITNSFSISESPLDIVFTPPDPTVYFNGISAINDVFIEIVLKDNQTNLTKTITVNFLGMVDIIN